MCCVGVRRWELLLGVMACSSLLANVCLLHLSSILIPSLHPLLRPFPSLENAHPSIQDWRLKREVTQWNITGVDKLTLKEDKTSSVQKTSDKRGRTENVTFITTTQRYKETGIDDTVEDSPWESIDDLSYQKSNASIYNRLLRVLLYSSAGVGMLLAFLFNVYLGPKIPPHYLAAGALIWSGIVTPWQPFLDFYPSVAVRMTQGAAFFLVLPLVECLMVEWAPVGERPFFVALLLCSLPFSAAFLWPVCHLLSQLEQLPEWSAHALAGANSVVVAGLLLLFFQQYPHSHTRIDGVELNKIRANKAKEFAVTRRAAPNVKSTSFWSSMASSFSFFFSQGLLLFYLPAFLASTDVMDTSRLGISAAIPFFTFPVVLLFFSMLPSSASGLWSRVCNTFALMVTAVLLVLLPIMAQPESNELQLAALLIPLGVWSSGSCRQCLQHISRRLLPALFLPLAFAFLLIPPFVNFFVFFNVRKEWLQLFLVAACVICVFGAPFLFFARPLPSKERLPQDLRTIDNEDECGLTELQLLPPAGKYLA